MEYFKLKKINFSWTAYRQFPLVRVVVLLLIRKMVVVVDVDKVLTKNDLNLLLAEEAVWPWPGLTHFVRTEETLCYHCGRVVAPNPNQPTTNHLIINCHNRAIVATYLATNYFWCVCGRCLYDHYPPDECLICDSV